MTGHDGHEVDTQTSVWVKRKDEDWVRVVRQSKSICCRRCGDLLSMTVDANTTIKPGDELRLGATERL
jgi:hypothetical protein